jgi:hypothetical protein
MFSLKSLLVTVLLDSVCLSSPVAGTPIGFLKALEARQANGSHWVDTWTSMPQLVETANLPPSPFVSFLCPNAFDWLR